MTTRKNARTTGLAACVTDYTIRHDGGVWRISAKDFPATEIFRVYRIEGDVNRLEDLTSGIIALFGERGIERRSIELHA